jgi:hypothetical protein
VHCWNDVATKPVPVFVEPAWFLNVVDAKPFWIWPTGGTVVLSGSTENEDVEIDAITWELPAPFAFMRTFVMRSTRETPVDTGGRIGTPKNVTWLPLTTP